MAEGAPARAATASMAVTPGVTTTSMSRHSAGPFSIASQTAAAMAKTPGSPPETTRRRRQRLRGQCCGGPVEFLAIVRGDFYLVTSQ